MRQILTGLVLAMAMAGLNGNPIYAQTRVTGGLETASDGPLEQTKGLETEYGTITTQEGLRLRSILTRPEGTSERLPVIFVTQWVSCDTIVFPGERDTQLRLLAQQSGMVMIRIERSGTGDSEGAGCDKLDYDTEVRHYREALVQAKQHPWVNPQRVVILGSSLGSTTAPLVAQNNDVAGVVVQGGGAVTYLERMINFERLYVERSGAVKPENIHPEMLQRIAFLQHYLIGQKTPDEVVSDNPELAGIWQKIRGTNADDHYGRPFAWHWQAAEKNFLAAWLSLDVPVLVVFGEYEQFETRHGHRMIVDMINRRSHAQAEWLEIKQADHGLALYPDKYAAYAYQNRATAHQLYVAPVSQWLSRVVGSSD
ncbi:alpha/beta hydrolase [Parasphingorhabdus cellanae]|uniref:Alpha/beta hydrolase n=1 Tax=Parasphingorhabdus cellanae TaxID=2806553 RepID=A0ABX7T1E0_9SPHN|nr:alpha/beta hydrolase [Parasphingorhabdus cellanae]QTD55389.1 alpha/beta hydrolase [Parasphingorhabdus cellanae]